MLYFFCLRYYLKNIFKYIHVTIYVKISWFDMLKLLKITDVLPIDLYISKLKLLLTKLNRGVII